MTPQINDDDMSDAYILTQWVALGVALLLNVLPAFFIWRFVCPTN
jgi:hypothetical protein